MEVKEEFLLNVAKGLVDEVIENTESVVLKAQELKSRANLQGFWDSLKTLGLATSLIWELEKNLNLAIKLCDKVLQSNPDIIIENGLTAKHIQSIAYFQLGFIAFMDRKFKEAVQYYEKSLSILPDQTTYFNLGISLLQIKGFFTDKTPQAITAFQKCIEIDPNTKIAIKAGMELARLGKL